MFVYILRRLILMVPTLLGITILVFGLVNMVPGGPVEQAIQRMRGAGGGSEGGGGSGGTTTGISAEAVAELREYYGFDKPVVVRYALWMSKIMRLDLGESYNYKKPVWELVKNRIPISLMFGLTGFLVAHIVCIPLGVYKAVKHGTKADAATSSLVFAGYAIPDFALGMALLVLFGGGSFWNLFPLGGVTSDNFSQLSFFAKIADILHHMALPILCYMVGHFATLTVLMKNSMMEVLHSDYVRTARAKGLGPGPVLFKHALRNSLIPIATGFGTILVVFVSSSLLIEVVFNIHGMGLLSYEAIGQRDYPVTLGIILIISVLSMLGNLLSDVSYVIIDPRISFDRGS